MARVIRFINEFVPGVEQGIKKQTIRRGRKFKYGDRLYLFPVGAGKRRLRSTCCDEVKDIHISGNAVVILDNKVLCEEEKQQLAVDDGFEDFQHFMQFFKRGKLTLKGQLIRWL